MNIQTALVSSTADATIAASQADQLIPAPAVSKELGITRRTLGRWFISPNLGFPNPIEINRRLYFRRTELEVWKSARIGKPQKPV